jgi:tRNA1(Val) A37 N6-methylase TrmN6
VIYPELVHDLLGSKSLKIIQRDDLFKLSLDAILLSDFVRVNPRTKKIIDLGSGLGPIPLLLTEKTKAKIIGLEINPEQCLLSQKSVVINNLSEQIEIIQDDIRVVHSRFEPSSFDLAVCNPPFHKFGEGAIVSDNPTLKAARHEQTIDFLTLAIQAKRLLRTKGAFTFVHRAARLDEIFVILDNLGYAVKRMRFVHSKKKQNALMVLIEATAGGQKGDLKVLPPLVVHDEKGNYSKQLKKILMIETGDVNDQTF